MGSYFEKVNYLMPVRIVADKNALDDIGEEVVGLGKKAFIVTGKTRLEIRDTHKGLWIL